MHRRKALAGLGAALLGAAALLSACATGGASRLTAQVASQGSWPPGRAPGSFAIERLPSQQANGAEQDRVEAAALPVLEAAGFRRAASAQEADVLVQVGARVFEIVRRDPFAGSLFWRNDWWFHGAYHRPFYGPAWGWGGPYGWDSYPSVDYQREAAVLVRDRRSQQVLYETRATSTDRLAPERMLPALFEAAMKDFAVPALSPRSVTLSLPGG